MQNLLIAFTLLLTSVIAVCYAAFWFAIVKEVIIPNLKKKRNDSKRLA
jgi:hypothetical protein